MLIRLSPTRSPNGQTQSQAIQTVQRVSKVRTLEHPRPAKRTRGAAQHRVRLCRAVPSRASVSTRARLRRKRSARPRSTTQGAVTCKNKSALSTTPTTKVVSSIEKRRDASTSNGAASNARQDGQRLVGAADLRRHLSSTRVGRGHRARARRRGAEPARRRSRGLRRTARRQLPVPSVPAIGCQVRPQKPRHNGRPLGTSSGRTKLPARGRSMIVDRSAGEQRYPCDDCGVLRTKAEGGTVFTVCDDCWDKHHPRQRVSCLSGCPPRRS